MSNSQMKHNNWKCNFFMIIIGNSISVISSSAVQFSIIWWLASETSSPIALSLASLSAFLPQIILSPFIGVIVDRVNRKRLIILSDLSVGTVALITAIIIFFAGIPKWMIYIILIIRSIGSAFHTPGVQSIIPVLVPKEELIKANGWSQFLHSGGYIIGPILGAAMYSSLPFWLVLCVDFAGALIASIALGVVSLPQAVNSNSSDINYFLDLKEGFNLYLTNKNLFFTTVVITISMIFYTPLTSFYRLMISDHFHATAWHASVQEIIYASGLMLCSLIFSKIKTVKNKFLLVHIGLIILGMSTFICGILPSSLSYFGIFLVMAAIMGASINIYQIPYISYLQETIDMNSQGRVFSLYNCITSLSMPVGLIFSGPIAEKKGVAYCYIICGIVLFFMNIICALVTLNHIRKNGV